MGTVPNGTAITPGATGAEGSWTQIAASSSEDHFGLVTSFQVTNDAAQLARNLQVDLGIGAAAAEKEIGSYQFSTGTTENMWGPSPSTPILRNVPSGTRLSARASCNGTIDSGYDIVIHGLS
jgi:hypothetical protein